MPTETKGKPWTEERKQAARDAYNKRQRENQENANLAEGFRDLPIVDLDEALARIRVLERENFELLGTGTVIRQPDDYPMTDVWPKLDTDRYDKSGHVFKYESTVPESGEWVYVETHDFHNQTGYSNNMAAWAMGMAKRAVSESRINPKNLPEFNIANKLEVRVRIIPG